MSVPVIETERLILRGHRLEDFDALARMWGDPEVVRYIGGKPSTRDESWARLLRYVGHWPLLGYGFWAVERKGDARFVGDVGFANWEREVTPPLDGMPEGGWVFIAESQGRGLATEAVRAAVDWIDANVARNTTACIINDDNAASIRVAHKLGYREFAKGQFKGSNVIQLRRHRADAA